VYIQLKKAEGDWEGVGNGKKITLGEDEMERQPGKTKDV